MNPALNRVIQRITSDEKTLARYRADVDALAAEFGLGAVARDALADPSRARLEAAGAHPLLAFKLLRVTGRSGLAPTSVRRYLETL